MTLLTRCVESYEIGCQLGWDEDDEAPMRRVLRTLSDYIAQNHYRSTGREIAVLLAAAGAEPVNTESESR